MPATKQTNFPPAFYAYRRVKQLSPAQHDELLANGWFRDDVNIFASSVKFMGDGWRSCVMLRVPLENFTWKKRLRKLMRKNGEMFTVTTRPFQQTQEKEALWQYFKSAVHNWVLIPQLDKHLLKDVPPRNFNTWELCVYQGEKLVAFSIFDRGERSIASLEAAYDPACQRYSLGVYTMLMEMEFAMQEGMAFYYPGFYPRDVAMFDYKLRPGNLEFFRLKEKRWLPLEALQESDWLQEQVLAKFEEVKIPLQKNGFTVKIGIGLFYSHPSSKPSAGHYNILLVVKKQDPALSQACLLAWDPVEGAFMAFASMPMLGVAFWNKNLDEQTVRLLDVSINNFLGKYNDPDELAVAVGKAIG